MNIENYIIDQVDIDNFRDACKKLRETLEMIRYYVPSAHYYVTPSEIHLMIGYGDPSNERDASEQRVDGFVIPHMDCGDW